MDRRRLDSAPVEVRRQSRGRNLRPGEDEDLAEVLIADEMGQQLFLPLAIDDVEDLADGVGSGSSAPRPLDGHRVRQDAAREGPDLVRERRREHQVLALRRERKVDDPADVRDEAHVEHPVGLVEDEDLDLAEVDRAAAEMVEQAPGGRDEHLTPAISSLRCGSSGTLP